MSCSDKKSVKQDNSDDSLEANSDSTTQELDSSNFSEYLNDYKIFFSGTRIQNLLNISEHALKESNISYNPRLFQSELNISVIGQAANSHIVTLTVSFAYFLFEVTLLNMDDSSRSHSDLHLIGHGAYSRVYLFKDEAGESFAIKSISYWSNSEAKGMDVVAQIQKSLRNSIFQYCLYKLFSALKVGPHLPNCFGFDLLIFDDTIEFAMEVCKKFDPECMKQLVPSLYLMHHFHIIHGDITVSNIMWSPTNAKNVFMDFGLSQFVKQTQGKYTLTHYFGTYDYTCPQMKQLFHTFKVGYVDLYYNDIHALKMVIQNQSKSQPQLLTTKIKEKQGHQFYANFIHNMRLIKHLYSHDIKASELLLEKNPNFKIVPITLGILKQLQSTRSEHLLGNFMNYKALDKFKFERAARSATGQQKKMPKKSVELPFKHRIVNINGKFQGAMNQIMLFVFFFFRMDITPRALQKSRDLHVYLKEETDYTSIQFWRKFVEYSKNPYTTSEGQLEILVHVAGKIGIKTQQPRIREFQIYNLAKRIAMKALEKYGVNLFILKPSELNEKEFMAREYEMMKLHLSPELYDFFCRIQGYMKQLNQPQLKKTVIDMKEYLEKQYKGNYPYFAELFVQAFDIYNLDNVEKPIKVYEWRRFIKKFIHFEAVSKIPHMLNSRRVIMYTERAQLNQQQYISYEKNFYKNNSQLCLELMSVTHVHLVELFLNQMPAIGDIQHCTRGLEDLIDFCIKLGDNALFQSSAYLTLFQFYSFLEYEADCRLVHEGVTTILQLVVKLVTLYADKHVDKSLFFLVDLLRKVNLTLLTKAEIKVISEISNEIELQVLQECHTQVMISYFLLKISLEQIANNDDMNERQVEYYNLAIRLIKEKQDQHLIKTELELEIYSKYVLLQSYLRRNPEKQANFIIRSILESLPLGRERYLVPSVMASISLYFASQEVYSFSQFYSFFNQLDKKFYVEQSKSNFTMFVGLKQLYDYFLACIQMNKRIKVNTSPVDAQKQICRLLKHFDPQTSNQLNCVTSIFQLYFQNRIHVFEENFLMDALKFSYYASKKCNFTIGRNFRSSMSVWMLLFIEGGNLRASAKKRKHFALQWFRNHQFEQSELVQRLTLGEFQSRARENRARSKVLAKFTQKYNQFRRNREQQNECSELNSLHPNMFKIYYYLLNRKSPHQVKRPEQASIYYYY